MKKIVSLAVLAASVATPALAQKDDGAIRPVFVCEAPKGYANTQRGTQHGWASDALVGSLVIVKRGPVYDVLTMDGAKLLSSIVDQGAAVTEYGMNPGGGVLVATWPKAADIETYRIYPSMGGAYRLAFTRNRHGATDDATSGYVSTCVAAPATPTK